MGVEKRNEEQTKQKKDVNYFLNLTSYISNTRALFRGISSKKKRKLHAIMPVKL